MGCRGKKNSGGCVCKSCQSTPRTHQDLLISNSLSALGAAVFLLPHSSSSAPQAHHPGAGNSPNFPGFQQDSGLCSESSAAAGAALTLLTAWAIWSWCFEEFARFPPDGLKKTGNVQGLCEGKWSASRGKQVRVWRVRASLHESGRRRNLRIHLQTVLRIKEWSFLPEGKILWKNVFWGHGH